MAKLRLGLVTYLGFLPLNHSFKEKMAGQEVTLEYGTPTKLHEKFLDGKLDIIPISPIKYARYAKECLLIPDLSVCSKGTIVSVHLFSKKPVTELEGRKICLSSSSETSVILLKILLEHYYHVHARFLTCDLHINNMLEEGDAGLLIGDEAINALKRVKEKNMDLNVTDLGQAWRRFTGEKMVYSLWAIRKEFAEENTEMATFISKLLIDSKPLSPIQELDGPLLRKAQAISGFSAEKIGDYFNNICFDFGEECKHALLTFYDYAYKSGLIEERVKLRIWDKILEENV